MTDRASLALCAQPWSSGLLIWYIPNVWRAIGDTSNGTEFGGIVEQNLDFSYMLVADYISKLRSEHKMVCALLEKESPPSLSPPFSPPDENCGIEIPNVFKTPEQLESSLARQRRFEMLQGYERFLSVELEEYQGKGGGVDTVYTRQKIMQIPEPRRTELINYIESRIGRKMKWRE